MANLTRRLAAVLDGLVKPLLFLPVAIAMLASACTTLENRRYLWDEDKVEGPYTRMLSQKPWPWPRPAETPAETAVTAQIAPGK